MFLFSIFSSSLPYHFGRSFPFHSIPILFLAFLGTNTLLTMLASYLVSVIYNEPSPFSTPISYSSFSGNHILVTSQDRSHYLYSLDATLSKLETIDLDGLGEVSAKFLKTLILDQMLNQSVLHSPACGLVRRRIFRPFRKARRIWRQQRPWRRGGARTSPRLLAKR